MHNFSRFCLAKSSFRDLPSNLRRSFGVAAEGERRVVVTGLGLVTPLAKGVDATWERLVAGHSGIRKLVESDLPKVSTAFNTRGSKPLCDISACHASNLRCRSTTRSLSSCLVR